MQFVREKEHWFLQQHLVFCEYLRGKSARDVRNDPALREAAGVYHKTYVKALLDHMREAA